MHSGHGAAYKELPPALALDNTWFKVLDIRVYGLPYTPGSRSRSAPAQQGLPLQRLPVLGLVCSHQLASELPAAAKRLLPRVLLQFGRWVAA